MTAFSAPFGAGIAYGARVPSAGLNSINTDLPKAPNFVDGGATYSPADPVVVGGDGIHVSGTGWRVLSAAELIVNDGGIISIGSGGVATFRVLSGALARINSGAAFDVYGSVTYKTAGPGGATWETGTSAIFSSGSTLTCASGSTVNLAGAVNGIAGAVGAWAGTWTFSNGLVVSGAALNANAGLTATTLTVSSTATFNDPVAINDRVTFSGTGAYRVLRASAGPDSSSTVNLWEADVWTAPITSNRLWTLASPPSNAPFTAIVMLGPSTGGLTLTLGTVNGGTVFLNAGTPHFAAVVVYDGSNYAAVVGAA